MPLNYVVACQDARREHLIWNVTEEVCEHDDGFDVNRWYDILYTMEYCVHIIVVIRQQTLKRVDIEFKHWDATSVQKKIREHFQTLESSGEFLTA